MGLVIAWVLIEIILLFSRLIGKYFPVREYPAYYSHPPQYTPTLQTPLSFDMPVEEMTPPPQEDGKTYQRIVTDPTPEVWDIVENVKS